jgi:hypothetical protein
VADWDHGLVEAGDVKDRRQRIGEGEFHPVLGTCGFCRLNSLRVGSWFVHLWSQMRAPVFTPYTKKSY